jgi:hypothetical protein
MRGKEGESYYFRSAVGIFWIRPRPGNAGRFILGIGEDALGSYASPRAAADDVYTGATGFYAWDSRNDPRAPRDLSEWERGRL